MSEFNLIAKYFTRPTPSTDLGVGDDAALISVREGHQLAISADMLVAGTHFFHDAAPYDIGWKSLAVNISDMAAMGATPKWATLAIALPEVNEAWLAEFSRGFFACTDAFKVDLLGGDTTRGPLTISIQIMGEVSAGKALQRNGAKIGDDIWVSGILGNAALGLAHLQKKIVLSPEQLERCLSALHNPQPRIALGSALAGLAHSAIDVSDGLLSDLGHILKASKVGAEIHLEHLPQSAISKHDISSHPHQALIQQCMLTGGDDYELCFTAPASAHNSITALSKKLNLALTSIGKITDSQQILVLDKNLSPVTFNQTGYDHFA